LEKPAIWIISKLPRATFSVMRPTGNLRKKRAKFSENEGKAVDDHLQKKPDYLKSIS